MTRWPGPLTFWCYRKGNEKSFQNEIVRNHLEMLRTSLSDMTRWDQLSSKWRLKKTVVTWCWGELWDYLRSCLCLFWSQVRLFRRSFNLAGNKLLIFMCHVHGQFHESRVRLLGLCLIHFAKSQTRKISGSKELDGGETLLKYWQNLKVLNDPNVAF